MTEIDFRVKHSELIEYYQLIEMRLKCICADLLADEDRGWFERLSDYESDPLGLLILKIQDLQKQTNTVLFTQDDFKTLKELKGRRNYWVHQCFGGNNPIVFSGEGTVKSIWGIQQIVSDLDDAMKWDEIITERTNALSRNK